MGDDWYLHMFLHFFVVRLHTKQNHLYCCVPLRVVQSEICLTGRFVLGAVLSLAVRINEPAHPVVWVAVASRCQAALQHRIEQQAVKVASRIAHNVKKSRTRVAEQGAPHPKLRRITRFRIFFVEDQSGRGKDTEHPQRDSFNATVLEWIPFGILSTA